MDRVHHVLSLARDGSREQKKRRLEGMGRVGNGGGSRGRGVSMDTHSLSHTHTLLVLLFLLSSLAHLIDQESGRAGWQSVTINQLIDLKSIESSPSPTPWFLGGYLRYSTACMYLSVLAGLGH